MLKLVFGAAMLQLGFFGGAVRAQAPDPQTIVHEATDAVVRGGEARLVERWSSALAHHPPDRLASLGLATVARLTFQYDEADRRYIALHESSDPGDRISIYAGLGRGEGLIGRGILGKGDSVLDETAGAARAAHDSSALVEALLTLASVRAVTVGPLAAATLLRGADRLIPAGDSSLLAEYDCTRVAVRSITSPAQVRAVTQASAALARRSGDIATEAECRFELADALIRQGDFAAAIPVLDTIEHQLLPAFDHSHLAIVRQNRAFAEAQVGLYGPAMASVQVAVAQGTVSHNLVAVAFATMTLARMYLLLGDVSTAADAAKRAADLFAQVGNRGGEMTASALGAQVARDAGDTAAARAGWMETRRLAQQFDDAGYLSAAEDGLADVETRERRWHAAAAWLEEERHVNLRRHLRNWESGWWYAAGTLAVDAAHPVEAERDFQAAIRATPPGEHDQRFLIITRGAGAYVALGDTARAKQELEAASAELEQWRSTLTQRELRVLAFQRKTDFGGPDPSVALVIAAIAKAGHAEAAFALAERRRARDLRDQLQRAAALGGDQTAAAAGPPTDEQADASAMATVQAALPNDSTAFLEFVTGPANAPTTLFVLTRRDARTFFLPPADSLLFDVQRLVALVEDGLSARFQSEALGAKLLGQALGGSNSSITHLVIVADGPLQRLPFAALRLPGRGYIVEHYAISLAPSGLVVAQLVRRPVAGATRASVLAFGDPHFSLEQSVISPPAGEVFRNAFRETGGLPRLPASADEARLVARFGSRAVVRLRDSASANYFKRAPLDSFTVIHLATHAIVDDRTATRTALALAASPGESGFITPADLSRRPLRADLVVLSACRAAGGVLVTGEGIQGLTAPLLGAGARAVVASQWEIGDRQTVTFMRAFYEGLADRRSVDEALRLAQLAALHRGAPVREWAAFTVTGDPVVRVPLVKPRFDWLWRVIGR